MLGSSPIAGAFDVVVTHDAEDLMHPKRSLGELPHPEVRHGADPGLRFHARRRAAAGVYCDEFAEYQSKELAGAPAPRRLPAF